MRGKRSSRVDYHDFPPAYPDILERFARDKEIVMGPMSHAEASALRFKMYTYRGLLRNAPRDDAYAQELSAIAETMTCTLERRETDTDSNWFVRWELDPIVRFMQQTT